MLEDGEIDALFTANVPQCVLDGSPRVTRLFPDFEPLERDYYRRTRIFPIMHTVVVLRELLAAHPGLTRSVYRAFLDAKDMAADGYRRGRRLYQVPTMVPWMNALFEHNRELFAEDWWPYGVSAEPHGDRHLPALPLRTGSVAAAVDGRGDLRAHPAGNMTTRTRASLPARVGTMFRRRLAPEMPQR